MDYNLRLSKHLANEMISESKRQNKIYSYLDTIKGAGMKHYNSSKSGAGKGWTNWVTVNDTYNEDMAKRVMEISRLGVAKDEAVAPIPDIKDSNQLFQINKFFEKIKSLISSFNEQGSSLDFAEYEANIQKAKDLTRTSLGEQEKYLRRQERAERITQRIRRGDEPVDVESGFTPSYEDRTQGYNLIFQQFNSNNESYQIINTYNTLISYLVDIVGFKKLSQSDKNKLNDKFDELIPLLSDSIPYADNYQIENRQQLKKLLTKLISRDYTVIKFNTSDLADKPSEINNDTSGAVRRGFDIVDFEDGKEAVAVAEKKPDPFAELVEQMKISRGPISRPSRKEPVERPFSFAGEQSERLPPALPPSPRMRAEPRQLPPSSFYAGQPYERIIADAREYGNTETPIPMDLIRAVEYYKSLGYPVEKDLYGEESAVSGKGRRKKRVVKSKNIVVDEIIPTHDNGNDIFNVLKMFGNPNISGVSLTTEKMDKRNEGLYKKKNK
jgi:hypothetical protein